MPDVRLDQINYKGRLIKVGHPVRVLPTRKGGRDGFDSLVKGFFGHISEDPESGQRKGKVTGIEVTDPKSGATRILGPERIIPYLRNWEAKAQTLKERKSKVVPITSGKAKAAKKTTQAEAAPKLAAATKAAKVTRAAAATHRARKAAK
jgi:hypothetical protein